MESVLAVLCGVLVIIVVLLSVKIFLIRKSLKEIGDELTDFLSMDTNAVITISSSDKYVRELAETLNKELSIYQKERHRYNQGDIELKNAVTSISHDLRTPLTAISGYLELMKLECMSGSIGNSSEILMNMKRYLELIENRTEVMKQLTEELFRYSVIMTAEESSEVSNNREKVVLNEVIEESIACYYAAFKENGITPDIQLTETRIERDLNRSALVRIISNVISNALKYSDGDFNIIMDKEGIITFSNHAKGLDPLTTGKLFDRFYTVETGQTSTGLGLSIAKKLTEKMNGNITAGYEDGQLKIKLWFHTTGDGTNQAV